MDPAAIVTIAGVGLIVAALAVYLITISYILVKVSFTLGTILIGVRSIADRCEPLQPIVGAILENVSTIHREVADITPEGDGASEDGASGDGASGDGASGDRAPRRRRSRRQ